MTTVPMPLGRADGRPPGPLRRRREPAGRRSPPTSGPRGASTRWAWRSSTRRSSWSPGTRTPLSNHQILAVRHADGLGLRVLHLPVGGQRQDARHGHPRPAGGDEGGRAHQRPPGRPPDHRTRVHPVRHAGHRLPRHHLPAERRALNDFIAGTAVVYDWDARAARLRWIARTEGTHRGAEKETHAA